MMRGPQNAMGGKSLVTIGLPVRNEQNCIRRAVDSLLAQDYQNIELIISDNASTDRTTDICREYARQDTRVRYYRSNTNAGANSNFRRVLELARGEYFMWAGANDYWMPRFVGAMIGALEPNPDASVAMCAVKRVREDGTTVDVVRHVASDDPNQMRSFNLAMALAAGKPYHLYVYGMYRTDLLRKAFDGFPSVMAGDRLFVCRVALATKLRYVDEILHVRLASSTPRGERYKDEELGRIWRDPWGPERTVLAAGPYLWRSTVVPSHRKLWIPLVVLRFAARDFAVRWWYLLPIRSLYVIAVSLVGSQRRKVVQRFVRRIATGTSNRSHDDPDSPA